MDEDQLTFFVVFVIYSALLIFISITIFKIYRSKKDQKSQDSFLSLILSAMAIDIFSRFLLIFPISALLFLDTDEGFLEFFSAYSLYGANTCLLGLIAIGPIVSVAYAFGYSTIKKGLKDIWNPSSMIPLLIIISMYFISLFPLLYIFVPSNQLHHRILYSYLTLCVLIFYSFKIFSYMFPLFHYLESKTRKYLTIIYLVLIILPNIGLVSLGFYSSAPVNEFFTVPIRRVILFLTFEIIFITIMVYLSSRYMKILGNKEKNWNNSHIQKNNIYKWVLNPNILLIISLLAALCSSVFTFFFSEF